MSDSLVDALWGRIRAGVIAAMATPLRRGSETIDPERVGPLVDFLASHGVVGLFVGGTMGEGILLPIEERMRLHEECVRAARGRVVIIAHIGDNNTSNGLKLARHAEAAGVDAVAAVTPSFYPVPDPSLVRHYAALGQATALPLLAYDIPQMAVNGVSPTALREMCETIPSFAGVKSSRSDTTALLHLLDSLGPRHGLLAGFEPTAAAALSLGAHGLVSGLATAVPEPVVALARSMAKGDLEQARKDQATISRVLELVPADHRIGYVKSILAARGVPVGDPIPPRPPGDPQVWTRIAPILQETGIRPDALLAATKH